MRARHPSIMFKPVQPPSTLVTPWQDLGTLHPKQRGVRLPPMLGRRVEVFLPEEKDWFPGYVAKQGTEPRNEDDGEEEEGVGWMIVFDDGDSMWMKKIRGNPFVRFIGTDTSLEAKDIKFIDGSYAAALKSDFVESETEFDSAGSVTSNRTLDSTVPHYKAKTRSSVQAEFSDAEQLRVNDAFRSATFQVLAKLPSKIEPDAVAKSHQRHLSENLAPTGKPAPTHKSLKTRGLFEDFGHLSSEYSLAADFAKVERLEGQRKIAAVAGGVDERTGETFFEPFQAGHATASRRKKYEAAFPEPKWKLEQDRAGVNARARYPYVSDPFDAAKEVRLQARRAHESKIIGNPASAAPLAWIPAGRGGISGRADGGVASGAPLATAPTRKLLPEMVKELHDVVVEDWRDSNFTVHVDETDALVLRFETRTIDSMPALLSYMETLACDTSGALPGSRWFSKYRMRRAMEAWPRTDGGDRRRLATAGSGTSAMDASIGGGGRGNSPSLSPSSGDSLASSLMREVEDPGWCAFVLLPPWHHRHAPASTFQALHPKAKTYVRRRGKPGSDFRPTVSYGPSLLSRSGSLVRGAGKAPGGGAQLSMSSTFAASPGALGTRDGVNSEPQAQLEAREAGGRGF